MNLAKAQKLRVDLNHKAFSGLIEMPKKNADKAKKPKRIKKTKLDLESQKQVYWLYHHSNRKYTYWQLGMMFNVSINTICGIVNRIEYFEKILFPENVKL